MWHIFPVFWRKAEIGTLIRHFASYTAALCLCKCYSLGLSCNNSGFRAETRCEKPGERDAGELLASRLSKAGKDRSTSGTRPGTEQDSLQVPLVCRFVCLLAAFFSSAAALLPRGLIT